MDIGYRQSSQSSNEFFRVTTFQSSIVLSKEAEMSISRKTPSRLSPWVGRKLSRRQFLVLSSAITGGAALAACTSAAAPQLLSQTPVALPTQEITGQEVLATPAPDQMADTQTAILTHPQLALN